MLDRDKDPPLTGSQAHPPEGLVWKRFRFEGLESAEPVKFAGAGGEEEWIKAVISRIWIYRKQLPTIVIYYRTV